MAIDIKSEKLISPADYARMRPPGRNGRPMNIATAYRHVVTGVKGVRLEHVKIGGQTYTSVEAVERFVDRLTNGAPEPSASSPQTSTARRRAVAAAEAELDRLGV